MLGAEATVIPATYAKKKNERRRVIGEEERPKRYGGARGGIRGFGRGDRRGGRGGAPRDETEVPTTEAQEAPAAVEETS
jgi:hypothetical protein